MLWSASRARSVASFSCNQDVVMVVVVVVVVAEKGAAG
jgi:hypothetical protein